MNHNEETPIPNSYWVVPGKLLAGEYPRDYDDRTSPGKVKKLIDAGIVSFIDLTEDGELKCYDQLLGEGVSHQRFPIQDMSIPKSRKRTVAILDAIDDNLANDRPTYIHCWGGVGRTGTIVGCWLTRRGYIGQAALDELKRLWAKNQKSLYRHSPERGSQENYILNWKEDAQ